MFEPTDTLAEVFDSFDPRLSVLRGDPPISLTGNSQPVLSMPQGTVTTFPAVLNFAFPNEGYNVGDNITLQAVAASGAVPDFSTPDVVGTHTLTADATADRNALNAIVSGLPQSGHYYRIKRGDSPWSNTVLHGDNTAPFVVAPTAFSTPSDSPMVKVLTFSQPVEAFTVFDDLHEVEIVPLMPNDNPAPGGYEYLYVPSTKWRARWTGNKSQPFSPPADFNGDNVFEIGLDLIGANRVRASGLPVSFTVTDAGVV